MNGLITTPRSMEELRAMTDRLAEHLTGLKKELDDKTRMTSSQVFDAVRSETLSPQAGRRAYSFSESSIDGALGALDRAAAAVSQVYKDHLTGGCDKEMTF